MGFAFFQIRENFKLKSCEVISAGGDSRWSPSAMQSLGKEHDMEDDHTPHRKSVLAKVREKARKWRNTLSKKKHNEDGNATPSWGVSLEDEDDEDEDPEYLGAPSNKHSKISLFQKVELE